MYSIKLNFIYFLIAISLIPLVSANSINIDNPFVRVNEWKEIDAIKDNDLNVNMSLSIT